MARKPVGYWENRSTKLMKNIEYQTEHTINSLIQAYNKATSDINKEIVKIFNNYAKDGVLDKNVLKQLLTTKESDTYYKNLLSVINNNITDENIKKKLLAKYNAPAYAYRISRYEALQNNIDVRLKELANIEQNITRIRYINTIKEGYYHTIFDTQKGLNLGFSFAQIDDRTIKLLLNEKWVDNANFSQRIWKNSEKLNKYLKTNLTAASVSGKSINKISEELSDYMQVGLFESTRLVRTEVNHFANESEMLAYDELEIEKYQFIATLDKRTCVHCGRMDGRIFKLKEKKAGVNYPPLHPNDRCTTVAVFDDEITDDLKRRARDENGESVLVPQNMSYDEWKEKYIQDESTLKIQSDNAKIKTTSKSQWKDFKTMDEVKEYVYNRYIDSDIDKIRNVQAMNTTLKTLDRLQKGYPLNQDIFIRNKTLSNAAANGNYQGININTSHFNKANSKALLGDDWIENVDKQISELKKYLGNPKYKQRPIENGIKKLEEQKKFKCFSISSAHSNLESIQATVIHEYGHVLADQYFGQINKVKANKNFEYFESNECWQKCKDVSKVYIEALKNNDIYDISYYASTNEYEFFAECFAKKQMGGKLPDYINKMLERVLTNGK